MGVIFGLPPRRTILTSAASIPSADVPDMSPTTFIPPSIQYGSQVSA